jgi:hypothetical protein
MRLETAQAQLQLVASSPAEENELPQLALSVGFWIFCVMAVRLIVVALAAIVFLAAALQAAQVASWFEAEKPSSEPHPVFGDISSQVFWRMLLH